MATHNKTLERSKSAEQILQLPEGKETHQIRTTERVFTPEQCHILGEAYRLILSWSTDCRMQPVSALSGRELNKLAPEQALVAEVEA